MDVAFYLFMAAALLVLEYRILKGLWDARARHRWVEQMKKSWDAIK